jgi:hypothetical protein
MPDKTGLITAIVQVIGVALSTGVLAPSQAHAATTEIGGDAEHHALLDRLYAERIARAQQEADE